MTIQRRDDGSNPDLGIGPQSDVAVGSSDAAKALFNLWQQFGAFGRSLGEAHKAAGVTGNAPSAVTTPAIPAPVVAPVPQSGPQPFMGSVPGGNHTLYGLRTSHDKALAMQTLSGAVETIANNKQQEQVANATRDYTVLMGAIKARQNQQPGSPEWQHNTDIINMILSDDKKRKNLERVLGYDKYDPKQEEKKKADPDYQALQAAMSQGVELPGGATAIPQPAKETLPAQMQGLDPAAQHFMKRIPMESQQPLLTFDETRTAAKIAAGLVPNAEQETKLMEQIIKTSGEVGIKLADITNNREIENLKAQVDVWGKKIGYQQAVQVALIDYKAKMAGLEMESLKLKWDQEKEFNKGGANIQILSQLHSQAIEAAKQARDSAEMMRTGLREANKGKEISEKDFPEFRNAMDRVRNLERQRDSISNEYMKAVGQRTGADFTPLVPPIGGPNPSGTGTLDRSFNPGAVVDQAVPGVTGIGDIRKK